MLLWTNDPNWAIADPSPALLDAPTKSLELFLMYFQDREVHEHLTGDCDIAFINTTARGDDGVAVAPMALRLVVPRDPGTRDRVMQWWHPCTSWRWRHSGVDITDSGYTGFATPNPEYPARRFAVEHLPTADGDSITALDVVDVYQYSYHRFLSTAQRHRLVAFGVAVDDDRKLITLTPMKSLNGFKHQAFTLEPVYEVGEYLQGSG